MFLFLLLLRLVTSSSQDLCSLGAAEDYSPWIADKYGRLHFPVYNQDALDVSPTLPGVNLPLNLTEPCVFDWNNKHFVCTGSLDYLFICAMRWVHLTSLVVNDYKVDVGSGDRRAFGRAARVQAKINETDEPCWNTPNLRSITNRKSSSNTQFVELSEDTYKVAGEVFSSEIGIGMHLSIDLRPNNNYNGFTVEGDAFSNELRLGWKVQGGLIVIEKDGDLSIEANVSTIGEGGWQVIGASQISQSSANTWKWNLSGSVSADFLLTPLSFKGLLDSKLQEDLSWYFSGRITVKPLLIVWTLEATATPSGNERITIPAGLFNGNSIQHLMFRNAYFMGDFDKDALQGIVGLNSISFLDSKLEEVPRLDYLFSNLLDVKALYIEGSSMPNVKMGNFPILPSLDLLSFKGSGPLQLDGESFSWLSGSNLTFINLQDCNINVAPGVESVLQPVSEKLRYLDLSYTSLREENSLEAMLRGLRVTHLSIAGLQLRKVPRAALEHVSNTTQYLTLRGNEFRKVPEENMFSVILDFPNMPALLELDIKHCGINFIETGVFDALPALQRLYVGYNNVENVQEGWYNLAPNLLHIDLSWNGATVEAKPANIFSVQPGDGLRRLADLEIVDLSSAVFTHPDVVVKGLTNKTQELSLCFTNLENKAVLEGLGVPELTVLDLSGNPKIEYGSIEIVTILHSLTKLRRLHIRSNRITNTFFTAIREYTTSHNISVFIEPLTTLDLSDNNIKSLSASVFTYFPNLELIDLTSNSIAAWKEPIMLSSTLKILKISDNKIETITETMFKDLLTLEQLEIGRNPFLCDCSTQSLSIILAKKSVICSADLAGIWLRNGVFTMKRPVHEKRAERAVENSKNCVELIDYKNHSSDYYCYIAEEEDVRFLTGLNTTDLCTKSEGTNSMKAEPNFNVVYIGIAVLLSLTLIVAFVYWKWWEIRLLTRAVRNAAILSFLDQDEEEPSTVQYSAFVSYSDKDRQWVLQHLLPRLEQWSDVSVCLHERDFQVGMSIMENITSSMDKSRNLVLVLSQAFMRSQWCQFELHLAQHRLVASRRDRLLLVLLEPIPAYKKPKTLRYLMRVNTYLEWPGEQSSADVERFWDRLLRSLAPANTSQLP